MLSLPIPRDVSFAITQKEAITQIEAFIVFQKSGLSKNLVIILAVTEY